MQSSAEQPASTPDWLTSIFDRPSIAVDGPILSFRDVSVRFGGVAALSEISFDVQPHDVLAVVGPNGAGKSTLLNAISGLLRDNVSGEILFGSRPILGKPPTQIARLGVGRSFQNPPLIDAETAMENLLVGAHLRLDYRMGDQIWRRRRVREREAEARERALAIFEFMSLSDIRDVKVGGLSYGIRKLVDIARALISGPQVLLLDEPTSGLDQDEQQAVGRLLGELHRVTPVTILIVEHHMDVVRTVANKMLGLQSGSVLISGTPDEVFDSSTFRTAIVGGQTEDVAHAVMDQPASRMTKD